MRRRTSSCSKNTDMLQKVRTKKSQEPRAKRGTQMIEIVVPTVRKLVMNVSFNVEVFPIYTYW